MSGSGNALAKDNTSAKAKRHVDIGQAYFIVLVNPKFKEYNRPFTLAAIVVTATATITFLIFWLMINHCSTESITDSGRDYDSETSFESKLAECSCIERTSILKVDKLDFGMGSGGYGNAVNGNSADFDTKDGSDAGQDHGAQPDFGDDGNGNGMSDGMDPSTDGANRRLQSFEINKLLKMQPCIYTADFSDIISIESYCETKGIRKELTKDTEAQEGSSGFKLVHNDVDMGAIEICAADSMLHAICQVCPPIFSTLGAALGYAGIIEVAVTLPLVCLLLKCGCLKSTVERSKLLGEDETEDALESVLPMDDAVEFGKAAWG